MLGKREFHLHGGTGGREILECLGRGFWSAEKRLKEKKRTR